MGDLRSWNRRAWHVGMPVLLKEDWARYESASQDPVAMTMARVREDARNRALTSSIGRCSHKMLISPDLAPILGLLDPRDVSERQDARLTLMLYAGRQDRTVGS